MHNPRICCLCQKQIDIQPKGWAEGHNAEPIMNGRCCSKCNDTIVVPKRIVLNDYVDAVTARKNTRNYIALHDLKAENN